jgi:polyferredoxin
LHGTKIGAKLTPRVFIENGSPDLFDLEKAVLVWQHLFLFVCWLSLFVLFQASLGGKFFWLYLDLLQLCFSNSVIYE